MKWLFAILKRKWHSASYVLLLLPAWGFSQVPIDASETSITLSANALVANGIDSALLTIQLVDTEGTPLSTGGATVRAQSTLGAISPTPLTDHGDGTYSGVLVSGITAGTATVSANVNGEAISQTATVVFRPAPLSLENSYLVADQTTLLANGVNQTTVRIVLLNTAGTAYLSDSVAFLPITPPLARVLSQPVRINDSIHEVTLVAGRDTGAVTLQAEVERKVLTNTETVHLVNPSVSLELSTITVDTDMLFLPQRGTGRADSTLIRVTLIDETGVPLGNHTGTVQVQSTGGLLASSTAEYVDSLAAYITTMYSPTEAGEAQISATYNGELLGEEIQIRFIDVEIPQGISPNGDGLNETWILSGLDGVGSQVTVYNAQGEAVYYASPYSNEDPFLGTSNVGAMAGNELPNGTYYFRIAYGDTERNEVYNYLIIQR